MSDTGRSAWQRVRVPLLAALGGGVVLAGLYGASVMQEVEDLQVTALVPPALKPAMAPTEWIASLGDGLTERHLHNLHRMEPAARAETFRLLDTASPSVRLHAWWLLAAADEPGADEHVDQLLASTDPGELRVQAAFVDTERVMAVRPIDGVSQSMRRRAATLVVRTHPEAPACVDTKKAMAPELLHVLRARAVLGTLDATCAAVLKRRAPGVLEP